MYVLTMCMNHGDLHFGNCMWEEEAQTVRFVDAQFVGKAPAACDLAYLLTKLFRTTDGGSSSAGPSDDNSQIAECLKAYSAAACDAGLAYTFQEVCEDIAWLCLQRSVRKPPADASVWRQGCAS